jgi:hypothetical protein
MNLLLIGLGIVVLLGLVINAIVVMTITRLSSAEGLLIVVDGGHAQMAGDANYEAVSAWAVANGFEPDIVADFHATPGPRPLRLMLWRNSYKKTYLSAYTTPEKLCWEFVTILTDDNVLTTASTKDAMTLPAAPGAYIQAFDGQDFDGLFRRHEAGLVYLHENKGLVIVDRWEPTEVLILHSIQRQVAHVRNLPLWQCRGVYWYFIRRPRLSNKPVEQLYR